MNGACEASPQSLPERVSICFDVRCTDTHAFHALPLNKSSIYNLIFVFVVCVPPAVITDLR